MPVILITGSSTVLGYATVETPARNGHTIYATLRNPRRSPQLQQPGDDNRLPITILGMDILIRAGRVTNGNLETHNLTTCWVALKEK